MANIDKSAMIHKSAQIADDVIIGPNVVIGENVKLDKGVKIVASAYLEFCEIGENTVISPFASIGTPPQDLGYKGEPTKAIVGKNCLIKENVTINRAANSGDLITRVGDKCLFMVGAHVAHNCQVADEVILANLATLGGHIQVGFGVFIGGMSVFHQNIRIGEMSIISGFSAARQDILPYSKCDGRPAAATGLNVVGLKRRGVSQEDRSIMNDAFKLLVSGDYNTSQAVEEIIKRGITNQYVENMLEFIKSSKRGVTLKFHKTAQHSFQEGSHEE